jgi:hypothetical protein
VSYLQPTEIQIAVLMVRYIVVVCMAYSVRSLLASCHIIAFSSAISALRSFACRSGWRGCELRCGDRRGGAGAVEFDRCRIYGSGRVPAGVGPIAG